VFGGNEKFILNGGKVVSSCPLILNIESTFDANNSR